MGWRWPARGRIEDAQADDRAPALLGLKSREQDIGGREKTVVFDQAG
jgi:hypothetical protein